MQRTHFLLFFQSLFFVLFAITSPGASAQTSCPDLSTYYPDSNGGIDVDWSELKQRLAPLFSVCQESAEYFALYGEAQLNSSEIAEAAESLELALLLDPDNGAAQIAYAQALYLQGQLFSALELNQQILERQDVPPQLHSAIQERQQSWQALTRENNTVLDVLAGYDNNLNGAPNVDQVTLTLSGEPVLLALNSSFLPNSGPYMNFRLANRHRQLAPQHQHNFLTEVRGRVSEDTESDILQFDSRYAFIKPARDSSWQLNAGVSHLQFGGSSLYTATDASARYFRASDFSCKPNYGLALQHQFFHHQSHLNAVEGKASVGLNCPFSASPRRHQVGIDVSLLHNAALKSNRAGGDRSGGQLTLNWQFDLAGGEFRSQLSHTEINDKQGYSELLDSGAERWLTRSYLLLQYRRPLINEMILMINFYRQKQHSNLELFRSNDTSFEIGISFAL